ncbi:MAG: carboxypeptidase regulatory-like domain-containing protein [Elusimicrobia bacterium]|nr:carboxypeptidase regulatory-like domain-containing protein [Elusimicrobiota bacterium]
MILAACVPIPNRRHHAPQVTGTVVRDNAPVAGAEVLLVTPFTRSSATATSDAGGNFKLGPISELRLTRSVLGDPLFKYSLTIKAAGGEEYLGLEEHGIGNAPEGVRVACDLGKPQGMRHTSDQRLRYCSQEERYGNR